MQGSLTLRPNQPMTSGSRAHLPAMYSISGELPRPHVTAAYRAALVLVATAMLVLPLAYAALVLGAARLVWWHVTSNSWIVGGHANQWTLLLYLAPTIAGAILVFFLVKPIIARAAARPETEPLSRDKEPELFQLIEAICQRVGAPVPRRVEVDCRVNASAGFLPGIRPVIRRELVLTIGLPLVAGLSVRELAGVLAHEFGHFSQGGGMRLTALIRGINHWFARVVFERDRWDEKLDEWSRNRDARAALIIALARGAVFASRQVLTRLMQLGHIVSCLLLRQMEYDADAYEIQLAGTATFVTTSARLRELNAAALLAYRELRQAWQTGTAPMDLPQFMIEHEHAIEAADRETLQRVPDRRTGAWDTHPSDADRVSAAERAAATGILMGGNAPAASLFLRFDALCTAATLAHYHHDLGLDTDAVTLVDAHSAHDKRLRRGARRAAFSSFFGRCFSVWRPLHLPLAEIERLADAQLLASAYEARAAMASTVGDVAEHYRQFEVHSERRIAAVAAEEFLLSGGTIRDVGDASELAEPSVESAQQTQAWASAQQNDHNAALRRFEDAVGRRLACGAVLTDRASASTEMKSAGAALAIMSVQLPLLLEIHQHLTVVGMLSRALGARSPEGLRSRFDSLGARLSTALKALATALNDTSCPESLCRQPTSMAAFCRLSPESEMVAPAEVVDRFLTVYFHLLGLLAEATLRVEANAATDATAPAAV
jgi:Zn-dependent protease with chaperone function